MRRLLTVTVGILALTGGLARADDVVLPLPPADQQMITAKLGSIVGKALPSKPIEDVSVYFPLQEKATNYQVTAGPNAGKTQTLGLAKVTRPNGKSAWRFMFSPTLAGFVRQTGEGVVVITTPANPFVLKGMYARDQPCPHT